jgi:hypothetical protein
MIAILIWCDFSVVENIHIDQETDVLRAAVQLSDDRQRYHLTVVLDCRCADQLRLLRVPKILQAERQTIATIGRQVLIAIAISIVQKYRKGSPSLVHLTG